MKAASEAASEGVLKSMSKAMSRAPPVAAVGSIRHAAAVPWPDADALDRRRIDRHHTMSPVAAREVQRKRNRSGRGAARRRARSIE